MTKKHKLTHLLRWDTIPKMQNVHCGLHTGIWAGRSSTCWQGYPLTSKMKSTKRHTRITCCSNRWAAKAYILKTCHPVRDCACQVHRVGWGMATPTQAWCRTPGARMCLTCLRNPCNNPAPYPKAGLVRNPNRNHSRCRRAARSPSNNNRSSHNHNPLSPPKCLLFHLIPNSRWLKRRCSKTRLNCNSNSNRSAKTTQICSN